MKSDDKAPFGSAAPLAASGYAQPPAAYVASGPRLHSKTGNGHARWMLIECGSHYSHAPRVSPQLSARQKGQSKEVRSIAWRAQNRLNARYRRLAARGLHRNKIIVAIARELCGFLWELHHQVCREIEAGKAVAEQLPRPPAKKRPSSRPVVSHPRAEQQDAPLRSIPNPA